VILFLKKCYSGRIRLPGKKPLCFRKAQIFQRYCGEAFYLKPGTIMRQGRSFLLVPEF